MFFTRVGRQLAVCTVCLIISLGVGADTQWQRTIVLQPIEAVVSRVFYQPLAERLAVRDKAVIEAILPTAIDNLPRPELSALDQQLETILAQRYRNQPDAMAAQRQFANAISIGVRRAYLNRPLLTERQAMRGHALASIDVVLGRQIARYAKAVADKDQAAQVDILTELQNGLLVLSANQVEKFAIQLGEILQAETEKLFTEIEQPEKREAALFAALNPALLVFDSIKHRGPNALYAWLRQYRSYLGDVALAPNRLYLFDRIAGVMIGFDNTNNILDNLDELLDPANIAWGDCALGQMTARGVRTGNFACGMGPQCRPAPAGFGKIIPIRQDLDRSHKKKTRISRADRISPYGISAAAMKGDCQAVSGGSGGAVGAGGGGPSAGGGGTMAGVGGLSGCLVNAAFREAASSGGACRLNAMQNNARRDGRGAIGPAVRGVYGQGDCGTDPHMLGNQDFGGAGGPSAEELAARNEQTIQDILNRFSAVLADENSDSPIRQIGNTVAGEQLSEAEWDRLANDVRTADICGPPSRCDTSYMGTTQCPSSSDRQCDVTIIINVEPHLNSDGYCRASCQFDVVRTVLHEVAAHATTMVDQTGMEANHEDLSGEAKREANEADEAREHDNYFNVVGFMAGDNVADTAKSIAEAISAGQKQPGPGNRYEMCGPAAEALQDMMQCAAGGMAGVDGDGNPIPIPSNNTDLGSGLGNTGGNVDPSMEQWISGTYGDSVFARCTQQEGINVVGRDGNIYTIGGGSDWTSAQQCGALDCLPPARARSVGGLCRCVASGGGAAAVQAAIVRHQRRRSCGVMTPDCNANPDSPCCGGSGTGVTPVIPGNDPGRVFDIDEADGRIILPIDGWNKPGVIDSNLPQPTGDDPPGSPP